MHFAPAPRLLLPAHKSTASQEGPGDVNLPGRLHSMMLEFLSGDLAEAMGDGRCDLVHTLPHVCRLMYLAIHLDQFLFSGFLPFKGSLSNCSFCFRHPDPQS